MKEEPKGEITFGMKLEQMRQDLISIVDRMNRDKSYELAMKAEVALLAIADLHESDSWLDDLVWDWQPGEEVAQQEGK